MGVRGTNIPAPAAIYPLDTEQNQMTQYITRVELHDAVWSDYDKLHDAMRREGFSQAIAADDGTIYELPPAEYNYIQGPAGGAERKTIIRGTRYASEWNYLVRPEGT